MTEKSGLRDTLRRRRRAVDAETRRRAAADLAALIAELPAARDASRVALYLATDGEMDAGGVLDWALACGKKCYVPIVGDDRELQFAAVTAETVFRDNRFGIAEPVIDDDESLINARELDLVLLPLVGFDGDGNRLGMGGGFYDATFAYKKDDRAAAPKLVGLAFELQRVEKIAADGWDIPINAVATEKRIYCCDAATKTEMM